MKNKKKNKQKEPKQSLQISLKKEEINLAKFEYEKLQGEIQAFIFGSGLINKLEQSQIDICIKTAQSFGLNPLKREIHFVPREIKEKNWNQQTKQWDWKKTGKYDVNIIIGYEVYLKRAEATGRLDGWGTKIIKESTDTKCIITIHKKGWTEPFTHEVFLSEAKQDNSPVWTKMPNFQLKKVAISQGFRLAFPEEMAGLPYIPEEIGVGSLEGDKLTVEDKKPELVAPAITGPIMASAGEKAEILKLAMTAVGWDKIKVTQFILKKFNLKNTELFTSAQAQALIKGFKEKIKQNEQEKSIVIEPVGEELPPGEEITPEMVDEGIPADISGPILETDSEEVKRLKIQNNAKQ